MSLYGISDAERARLALLRDATVDEIDWSTVEQVAESLGCPAAVARSVIRRIAASCNGGISVEGVPPVDLAWDEHFTARYLRDLEAKGLPCYGTGTHKRYLAPVCYWWLDRFRSQGWSSGRAGWARRPLSALEVIEEELSGEPEDAA